MSDQIVGLRECWLSNLSDICRTFVGHFGWNMSDLSVWSLIHLVCTVSQWPESENVNLLEFVRKTVLFFNFDNKTELLINQILLVECHLKQTKWNMICVVLHLVLIVWLNWIRTCKFYQHFWRKMICLCDDDNWIVYKNTFVI
jgi:uncharacterized protein YybS (DUF2232 family)